MYADSKHHSFKLYEWVEANARWHLTIACLGRCRRLSKAREKSVRSSESVIKPAMIQRMLNRLAPSETDAEFHYRKAA